MNDRLTKQIARLPAHVQAGLDAYRAALNRREDWHRAVAAAIEAADAARATDPRTIAAVQGWIQTQGWVFRPSNAQVEMLLEAAAKAGRATVAEMTKGGS